ncbi:MAG TPA: hypothetical protein DEQ06_05315 [Porphyromonadaceae bacterium]|jgi:hypothetical protein|nr:hypothetical protein [Porphyromonadaceae bacterium]
MQHHSARFISLSDSWGKFSEWYKNNEFLSIDMLSESTNRSVDDEEVIETIAEYEGMVHMCDFLFENGFLNVLGDQSAKTGSKIAPKPEAKWCGKTSTARRASKSVLYMQDPDKSASYIAMADTKPSLLLKGANPRLLDEWQMAPVLWDVVRFEVDKRGIPGQFILTGSAVPADNVVLHTGTWRIARLLMRPMSLFESNDSNGIISLRALFDGKQEMEGISNLTIEKIAYLTCRGGFEYPRHSIQ